MIEEISKHLPWLRSTFLSSKALQSCLFRVEQNNTPQSPPSTVKPRRRLSQQDCLETLACHRIDAPHLGHIVIVELQRPAARNAISKQMVVELEELLDDLHQEAETNDVRAVIIASSLNEVFCAGADLKERSQMDTESTQSFLSHIRRVFSSLTSLPIPTIACVSGYALGGGLELALCCNFRVFSSNAVVGLPETRLAIIPGAGGTFRLQQVVGACHALDMILTGRRVGSKEAGQMGLSTRTVEVGDGHADDAESLRRSTLDAGVSLAKEIASGGPLATKAALRAAAGACEDAENAAYSSVLRSEDRNRALESFSKRGTALELEFLGR